MEEIWKDIPNYEGYYQASNLGRIKSLLFQNNALNKKYPREKILTPKITKDCCSRVELWKDGKHKTYLVYRLIATTFLENLIDTKMTVNHKDGNRLNNNIENLEWLTLSDNIKHGFRTGLYTCQTPIVLVDKETEDAYYFHSLSKASLFIGYNEGYISAKIIDNKYENKKYKWSLFK